MVASDQSIASEVGAQVMLRGGNAVDATVAVVLALKVTHSIAGNLGGGGFVLIRTTGARTVVIDYRDTAPARAHSDM